MSVAIPLVFGGVGFSTYVATPHIVFMNTYGRSTKHDREQRLRDAKSYAYPFQVTCQDGKDTLDAVYARLTPISDRRYICLYCHGNAGDVYGRLPATADQLKSHFPFLPLNTDIVLFDYRGYGHSSGQPSPTGVVQDAQDVWSAIVRLFNINPNKIILVGESLGGYVASALAANLYKQYPTNPLMWPHHLFVVSTFANLLKFVPWYLRPLCLHLFVQFRTDKALAQIRHKIRTTAYHSRSDDVIDYETHGPILQSLVDNFVTISGDHNNPRFHV